MRVVRGGRVVYRKMREIMKEEFFPLVDETGRVTGKASRKECHCGSFLLHPVVHLHVFDTKGRLLLQKRSMAKDIQPGRWDTAVGGHIDYGETIEQALRREAMEELGISEFNPAKAFSYPFRSNVEYELINSFYTVYEGELHPDPVELDDCRYWEIVEIRQNIGQGVFTPNFEMEFSKLEEMGIVK